MHRYFVEWGRKGCGPQEIQECESVRTRLDYIPSSPIRSSGRFSCGRARWEIKQRYMRVAREPMRVCEHLRALDRLSESGFAGFLGILRMASASWLGNGALYACSREMTRVHERLRLSESGFAGFLGILRMASASWIGNSRTCVVCVFTRDNKSPRAFTSVGQIV